MAKYKYNNELENEDNVTDALFGIANELAQIVEGLSKLDDRLTDLNRVATLDESIDELRADIGSGFDRVEHALRWDGAFNGT